MRRKYMKKLLLGMLLGMLGLLVVSGLQATDLKGISVQNIGTKAVEVTVSYNGIHKMTINPDNSFIFEIPAGNSHAGFFTIDSTKYPIKVQTNNILFFPIPAGKAFFSADINSEGLATIQVSGKNLSKPALSAK